MVGEVGLIPMATRRSGCGGISHNVRIDQNTTEEYKYSVFWWLKLKSDKFYSSKCTACLESRRRFLMLTVSG